MPNNNTTANYITPTQSAQSAAGQGAQATAPQGQGAQAAAVQGQAMTGAMPGLQQVQQQVADLRQTLHQLMADKQYADGEIMTASATLDAQLEDYYRTLTDKKQPGMRTY